MADRLFIAARLTGLSPAAGACAVLKAMMIIRTSEAGRTRAS